jgi:pyruvate dehydrogenase (quinone)
LIGGDQVPLVDNATFPNEQRSTYVHSNDAACTTIAGGPSIRTTNMSMNVSEFVWHRLSEWGLKRVYGYPGDGVGGLDVALEKAKGFMEYIQVRHEEMAAFMASAHAKFTGQPGLCYATSGQGAIHLLNGLYDAKLDHVPVVALVGQ